MKNVLIISYYFPPLGMGGTQRVASFAQYLPQFGWQPHILTVKNIAYHAHDYESLKQLDNVPILRTESLDPNRLLARFQSADKTIESQKTHLPGITKNLALKGLNFLFIPDNKVLWNLCARKALKALFAKTQFDCILSSGPPHSSHLLARKAALKYRLPWVADFRDGWAGGDFQPGKTKLHYKIDTHLQKKVTHGAQQILAVSSGLRESIIKTCQTKVSVLTNGFDAGMFRTPYKQTSLFEIVHVGSVGNFAQPDVFLKVLKNFKSQVGEKAFRVRFIGADLTGRLASVINQAGLSACVQHSGYLTHRDAVDALQKADLLLYLVTGNPSPGFIPGKTFEYLASGRPVLAVADRVEGTKLLLQSGAARLAHPNDEDEVLKALHDFFMEYKKDTILKSDMHFVEQFERRKLVEKLATVLDRAGA